MTSSTDASRLAPLTVAACVSAVVTALGSLYLTYVMELVACPLCFYQRTFALAAVGVLVMGLLTGAARGPSLSALALPLAVGGLSVALFHVWLELTGKLECPGGVLDLGTAPKQSAVAFLVLTALLLLDVITGAGERKPLALLAGTALGVLFAAGCILTAPKPAPLKPEDYAKPLIVCRPPQTKET